MRAFRAVPQRDPPQRLERAPVSATTCSCEVIRLTLQMSRVRPNVGIQPIQEPIPRLWRASLPPYRLEGGARSLGMVHGLEKDLRNIGAGDSIAQGKRKRVLCDLDSVFPSGSVQQDAGSDHGVLQTARANLSLRASTPEQRIALPQIQTTCRERRGHQTAGRHVEESAAESEAPAGGESVQHPLVLGFLDSPLANRVATSTSRRKHDLTRSVDCRPQRLRLGDVTMPQCRSAGRRASVHAWDRAQALARERPADAATERSTAPCLSYRRSPGLVE